MLSLTLGLGFWQVERLAWKQALLADIDRGERAPAVALTGSVVPFEKVVVEGRFLPTEARYGAEVRSTRTGASMGSHVLNALERPGGEPVIVDRGWAPADAAFPPPTGVQRIEAYVRSPEYAVRFGAADDPAKRQFYALDPAAIGSALGLPRVAPFTLVALGGSVGTLPEAATAMPRPPNNHLSYALTWFGLSGALVIVFGVYARQIIRSSGGRI